MPVQGDNRVQPIGPIKPQERIVEIDILRGFAVLGMLLWNFSSKSMGNYYSIGDTNHFIYKIVSILDVQHTVHLLFAFLFGWGLAKQIYSRPLNKFFAVIYLRRLSVLFIIGLIHLIFWYRPDFIHIYAVCGVILLLFVDCSDKCILITAGLLIGVPVYGRFIWSKFMPIESYNANGSYNSLSAQVIMFSAYFDTIPLRLQEFAREYAHPDVYFRNSDIFVSFLLGLYVSRRSLFENILDNMGFIRKTLLYSLLVYLLCAGWIFTMQQLKIFETDDYIFSLVYHLMSLGNRPESTEELVTLYKIQSHALFYVCLIGVLVQHTMWKKFFMPLAKVGQMALSNYLLHSLIGTTIFYGYGLDFYGKFGFALGEILAIFVFSLLVIISYWWLKKFQFGPIEWLWRSVTYWNLRPIKIREA